MNRSPKMAIRGAVDTFSLLSCSFGYAFEALDAIRHGWWMHKQVVSPPEG